MKLLFPYAQTTRGVTVRVAPSFLADQSKPEAGHWVWAYHIRVENDGTVPVQLISRHWIITDAAGRVEEVKGEGVVGEQPVIEPGGSFDYVSGCPLTTPTGSMEGHYNMVGADGVRFPIEIPRFPLVAPTVSS